MLSLIETIEQNWKTLQEKYSLRDKDKYRIIDSAEQVKNYNMLLPEEKGDPIKSDYEIISVFCYRNHWKMDFEQWNNFIACVRELISIQALS